MFRGAFTASFALLAATMAWTAPAHAGAPEDDLPDGSGKKILLRACTTCHDLDEVVKFKGYYTRPQWRDIVVTMKEYGAELTDAEVDGLADYIAAAIGKKE
jgi:mono/diheme cytochrome c family protein